MDFDSINNCMSDQQKLSLSAASLSAITGSGLTYDDINNKMNDHEKLSLIASELTKLGKNLTIKIGSTVYTYNGTEPVTITILDGEKMEFQVMANTPVVVLDDTLTNIANAIRGKNGSSDKYKPGQMADAIDNIQAGGLGIPREVIDGVYKIPEVTSFSLPSNATDVGPNALVYAFDGCTSLTSVDLSSLTAASGEQALYLAFRNCTGLTSVNLSSLTTVSGKHAFYSTFQKCANLTSVDLSSLTTVNGEESFSGAFNGCTSLTSVDLSALTTVDASLALLNSFNGCTSLTSVDLSSLTTVTNYQALAYAFANCTSLTSVDLSSLTDVSGYQASFKYAFSGCTKLASVNFSSLAKLGGQSTFYYAFSNCSSLTSLSFPALTADSFYSAVNQFNNMLSGVTGCTVHFPAAIQAKIETMTGYPNFGGTNTTVLFDLQYNSLILFRPHGHIKARQRGLFFVLKYS